MENENVLAIELEQQTEFQLSASVTIARLSASIENYKKERDRSPRAFSQTRAFSTTSSSNCATSSRKRLPELQLPKFTGSYTDWMSFYTYSSPPLTPIPISPIQKS